MLRARTQKGDPVRCATFEAGFRGRGTANQVARYTPGMGLVAICNRSVDAAIEAYARAGIADVPVMSTPAELDDEVRRDGNAVADGLLSGPHSERVQVAARAPAHVEYGARVTLEALENSSTSSL